MSDDRRLIAYELYGHSDMKLTAAPYERDWMDASLQRFAYRCLPLTIANQAGWLIDCPATFTAVWNGGPTKLDTRIQFGAATPPPANPWLFSVDTDTIPPMAAAVDNRILSHFGVGVVTFTLPWLFRTPKGINLWVKGPTNRVKDGAQALEGVVETDWLPSTFTMNWKLTRPHQPVHFEKGEPIAMIVPVPRGLAEGLAPVRLPVAADPELEREYRQWVESRAGFLQDLDRFNPDAVKQGWQKDYHRGITPSGQPAPEHQTRMKLKEFDKE